MRGMVGSSDIFCINAECPVVAVMVVGLGNTVTVERLTVADVYGGGCSGTCTTETGDRFSVIRAASWPVLAGGVAYCRN